MKHATWAFLCVLGWSYTKNSPRSKNKKTSRSPRRNRGRTSCSIAGREEEEDTCPSANPTPSPARMGNKLTRGLSRRRQASCCFLALLLEPILSRTSEPRAPYHTAGRPAAADRRNLCKNKIEVSKEEAGREEKAKRKPAGKKRRGAYVRRRGRRGSRVGGPRRAAAAAAAAAGILLAPSLRPRASGVIGGSESLLSIGSRAGSKAVALSRRSRSLLFLIAFVLGCK